MQTVHISPMAKKTETFEMNQKKTQVSCFLKDYSKNPLDFW